MIRRDNLGTPLGASARPVCTAKAPDLPSSSSMRGNLRQAPTDDHPNDEDLSLGVPEQEMNPAGVSELRTGCYHTGSVNVL